MRHKTAAKYVAKLRASKGTTPRRDPELCEIAIEHVRRTGSVSVTVTSTY